MKTNSLLLFLLFFVIQQTKAQCSFSLSVSTTPTCAGHSTGSAIITVTGGVPPYTFSGSSTSNHAYHLAAGTHCIWVIDASMMCHDSVLFTIDSLPEDPSLVITETIVPQTCLYGAKDGSIDLSITGTNAPYNVFWWHDSSTTTNATNLHSSSYFAIINSATTCNTMSYYVNSTNGPGCSGISGKLYFDINSNCVFDSTDINSFGYLFVNVDTLPYSTHPVSYTISTDTIGNYNLHMYPENGYKIKTYNLLGLDTNCIGSYLGTISSASPHDGNLDFGFQDNNFCGAGFSPTFRTDCATNKIVLNSDDNDLMYWNINSGLSYWQSCISFEPLMHYTILIRDTAGCTEFIDFTTPALNYLDSTLFTFSLTHETCNLAYNGAINTVYSGSDSLIYNWSNGMNTPSLTNLGSDYYQLYVSNTTGACYNKIVYIENNMSACGTITGQVFYDLNGNCLFDPGVDSLSYNPISTSLMINDSYLILPDSLGYFEAMASPGLYTIQLYYFLGYDSIYWNPCWYTQSVFIDSSSVISDTVFFPINTTAEPDMTVYCQPMGSVPGFSRPFYLYYNNMSNLPIDGVLYCVLDDTLTYDSSSVNPDYIIGDTLFWNITGSIYSSIDNRITIWFTTPPDPALLGSIVTNRCGFIPSGAETILTNNTCFSDIIVTGSYDPNDKNVSPTGTGPLGYIKQSETEELYYHINFQNTGTAPAHNVSIKDTISNYLDINSIEIIEASHTYTAIRTGNVYTFSFPSIMLPDSTNDEPNSHGFIRYKIKLLPGLPEFTSIQNTAYIYFDFNPPIVTNTTVNTIHNFLSVTKPIDAAKSDFTAYPNPFSNNLTIISKKADQLYNVELTDITGKSLHSIKNITGLFNVNTEQLPKGCYVVHIRTSESNETIKVVKQ